MYYFVRIVGSKINRPKPLGFGLFLRILILERYEKHNKKLIYVILSNRNSSFYRVIIYLCLKTRSALVILVDEFVIFV